MVQKSWKLTGNESAGSEKFYLKEVSPQEIAKFEYEDHIQKFGKMFDLINGANYYDAVHYQHGEKYAFFAK